MPSVMTLSDKSLIRKLAVVLLVKLILLTGLWWAFVRDTRVAVDDQRQAERLLSTQSPSAKGAEHDF